MKVVRSSTPSNRKNYNSARSIPPAGSFISSCANTPAESATSPTDSPDEADFQPAARQSLRDFLINGNSIIGSPCSGASPIL